MRVPVTAAQRYTAVAVALHWTIAAAIVANLALGWWMHEAVEAAATQARAIAAFQLHKSLGLTVLALSVLRLAWRLAHRPPPLPAATAGWERFAARATHWAFYALMIVVPLSGWTYVSAQWRGDAPLAVPTLWFGLFEVPHLFDAQSLDAAARKAIADRNFAAHEYLAWGMAALLALHVAAALKHRFVDRDAVLAGMLPASRASRAGALAALLLGACALLLAVLRGPSAAGGAATAVGDLPGANWRVSADSEIAFSGTHAGTPFRGRFTRWRAGIRFHPGDLAASSVTAEVETASARDGDALHEETLPQPEWFDSARHPLATFRSTRLVALDAHRYSLDGTLTIKDRALPVAGLVLETAGERLTLSGQVTLSRRDANLGMESDPRAEYVSDAIAVTVRVAATAAPE